VVVNTDAYNALSPEHKEALDSSVDAAIEHYLANYQTVLDKWDAILAEKNVTKVEYSDEELAKFREATKGIADKWIEEKSAQGLPAKELYDLVQAKLNELHGM
jgi:TRAP-type C4-dicarboxylate transport system substrate-binding protein